MSEYFSVFSVLEGDRFYTRRRTIPFQLRLGNDPGLFFLNKSRQP
jgi:hypothetical protein